jgi:hypothetical protein
MLIKEMYGLDPVVAKTYPKATPAGPACPQLLYGVELEIENVPDAGQGWIVGGIRATEDGSLRNHGVEFITAPMSYSNLSHALRMFFNKNRPDETNYSDRTSIHVHTNCQDLTSPQVQSIALLYQVFERLIYAWIGNNREENIYCVPWHQTNLTYTALDNPENLNRFKQWQKYTGLNLLPLFEYGTIEWRHMHGHGEVEKILLWCQLIGKIYSYILERDLEGIKQELILLNTSSLYEEVLLRVFQEYSTEFLRLSNYRELLEEGVLDMKYALMPVKSLSNRFSSAAEWLDNTRIEALVAAGNLEAQAPVLANDPPLRPQRAELRRRTI